MKDFFDLAYGAIANEDQRKVIIAILNQVSARWMFLTYLGVAFSVTYRAAFVNLGISGQLIVGAYIACTIGAYLEVWWVALLIAFIGVHGIGYLAVYFKHRWLANEILTTLFLTYIVIALGQLLMQPTGSGLMVASPIVPDDARPDWQPLFHVFPSVSWFYVPAIPAAIFLHWYLQTSELGYKLRIASANPRALSDAATWKMLRTGLWISSICITLALMGDVYMERARYSSHEYDFTGFLGIAVAMIAVSLERWLGTGHQSGESHQNAGSANWRQIVAAIAIPISSLFVAIVEVLFRAASVSYGVPAQMALVVFGIALFLAAIGLRKA